MKSATSIWLDGVAIDATLASNRAFAYGDGVFRTVLKHGGQVLDLADQLLKLQADAARIDLRLDSEACTAYRREIDAIASQAVSSVVLKLIVVRRAGGRGYKPGSDEVARYVSTHPVARYPIFHWTEGIVVERAAFQLAAQPILAGIKHLNRLEQVLAYRRASGQAEEILFADGDGKVCCGGRSNLFWVREGVLHTPDLASCGVAGHMRARVLDVAHRLRLPCSLRAPTWDELAVADEAFVTNSLIGIWPIRQFEQRRWSPGTITRRIVAELAHPCIAVGV